MKGFICLHDGIECECAEMSNWEQVAKCHECVVQRERAHLARAFHELNEVNKQLNTMQALHRNQAVTLALEARRNEAVSAAKEAMKGRDLVVARTNPRRARKSVKVIGTSALVIVRASDDHEVEADERAGVLAFYEKDFQAVEPYAEGEKWYVMDAECETLCECRSEAAAKAIAEALNAFSTTDEAQPGA